MTFNDACDRLFKIEGFYSNLSIDKGGATKYGITLESWAAYKKIPVSAKDISMIKDTEAREFYFDNYWNPLKLEMVQNDALKYIIFDQAVNRGLGTVVKQIQNILGLKPDGILGDNTLTVLNTQLASGFVLKFLFGCQMYYCHIVQRNPSQLPFITGWIKRTQELITLSLGG